MTPEGYVNTEQAAAMLTNQKGEPITPAQVRWLIRNGKLKAEKIGRDYLIPLDEIERAQARKKKPGPKPSAEQ